MFIKMEQMNPIRSLLAILLLSVFNCAMAVAPVENTYDVVILRVEKVGPEALGASASAGTATYTRVVARSANEGRFLVAIHSNAGILRMQGAYLDSTLTVADGIFKYYHPNGRLESTGTFTAGIKSGTWLRYGPDGKELSEQVYTGRSVDDLVQGTDRSPMTIGGPQLVDPSTATNKRRTVSSEF